MSYTTIVLEINDDGSVFYAEYHGKTTREVGAIPVDFKNHHILQSPEEVFERIGQRIEECKNPENK